MQKKTVIVPHWGKARKTNYKIMLSEEKPNGQVTRFIGTVGAQE